MFEGNDKDLLGGSNLDLGSSDIGSDFVDFADFNNSEIDNIFGNDDKTDAEPKDINKEVNVSSVDTAPAEQAATQTAVEETETEVKQDENAAESDDQSSVSKENGNAEKADETPNFFAEAIAEAEKNKRKVQKAA